jgi:hypothetical protein
MEWHTDLKFFLLDNLNFIQEQIEQAQNDSFDRRAAVDAARGVVPMLRQRLCGLDDPLATSFSLAAGHWWEGNNWTESWDRLNKPDEFDSQARDLKRAITIFRSLLTP